MRNVVGLVGAVLLALSGAAAAEPQSAQSGVAALLARSANAWNHGDLDAFMESYEDSPQTVYIGSKMVYRGYAAIRARYAGNYRPGQMGMLGVSDLAVRALGPDYAVATARWHVARTAAAGGDLSGLFSLVLHRGPGGWRIITDHTP